MKKQRISVRSGAGAYDVVCAPGVLSDTARQLGALGEFTGTYLLTSPKVARHWRSKLERSLRKAGWRATILFDDREAAKSLATVEHITRELVRAGADRRSLLVAMGGGVVGDVSGFAA